ncbi:hypothetical protein AUEXF2481DRAFT_33067 [Aureobasidium subglaciale EXF-2481]|uniref:Uncharacterized protein n=1 Tax=Aureobasidium subglaciale (strain EXF-2481) TaxID=1043005 RepID=A0A074YBE7_AURSE|nr:uncharacterized protein AUEXF2481DRAFT_33067 [Aureobasidium subglaciale EXF-2481]KEQ91487.1 hypothetical protein AUEXF2481DRAFT_33067 [Aureobasidium subglaciale EXF-2481]
MRGLKFDVGRRGRLHQLDLGLQSLRETGKSYLEPESIPFLLDIFLDREGRDSNIHFSFDQGELWLTLLKSEVSDHAINAISPTSNLSLSYDYLASARITRLHLQECTIVDLLALDSLLTHHSRRIETVTLDDVLILIPDRQTWVPQSETWESGLLHQLSCLTKLRYCRLSQIKYVPTRKNPVEIKWKFPGSLLHWPDGASVIELVGEDVPSRLEAIATWVEHREVSQ